MTKARLLMWVTGIFFLTAICCPAADNAGSNGKGLFESNCGKCHNLDRAKSKNKTKDGWTTTVQRMKKNGAALTDDEANIIINYLSENYK
jgi:mono/diheme cytochrome c family protein